VQLKLVAPPSAGAGRRLISVIWPLIVITALMLMLSLASISVLSSVRAYVNGESLWSKAEHQAMAELRKYAVLRREDDYRQFEAELAVPLGDYRARLALLEADPDLEVASRGFLEGRNDRADVPGMIRLFRYFHTSSLMTEALRAWTGGDALILELGEIGAELHAENQLDGSARTAALLAAAEAVHQRVVPLELDFSAALGDASRKLNRLLCIFLAACSVLLAAAGTAISHTNLERGERLAKELHASQARLKYQATHDALTGLTNRSEFEAQLGAAIEDRRASGADYSLLYIDLDQFKIINDTCGHAAGDELIKQVSWLIRNELRRDDLLARLGGDEFGALLPHCPAQNAVVLAEAIRRRIADLRFRWQDRIFAVNASTGVLALGEALPSVSDALSAADAACYLAKDNGRNRVQLYRPDDLEVQKRHGEMRWIERINAALDKGSFELAAQPIVPVSTRESGAPRRHFELLLRMVADDGQRIAPMAFIPAAERYGLMPALDRWVIARACRELARLKSSGIDLPTCMVNLSGVSVSDPSLADYIGECLMQNSIAPGYLGFELTETAAVGNLASASKLMSRLRAVGCPIALDDFGSGMSSFSYLKSLPIDFLKIDGEFVRDVNSDPIDHAVVEAIQRVGRLMGIKTIAECVEDEAALIALARIGVDYAQGYHLGRPIPLAEIASDNPKSEVMLRAG
jgi:diguanylate cyclase (GGDEF)-like protein